MKVLKYLFLASITLVSCSKSDDYQSIQDYPNVKAAFGLTIDLNNLSNYQNQFIPSYITKDNSAVNPITKETFNTIIKACTIRAS